MSDFIFNNSNEEEKDYKSNATKNVYEKAKQEVAERRANQDLYQIDLPDEVYQAYNENVIAKAENPEEAAHELALALKFSKEYNVSLDDAISNLDNYTDQMWGTKTSPTYKGKWKQFCDYVKLGNNNVIIGDLGNKLRQAELNGDEELANATWKQIEAYEADNESRLEGVPETWYKGILEAGATSLPFTGYTALAGMFGNFISPGAGTLAAWGTSTNLIAGQEYIDSRRAGYSRETSHISSAISGGIQGLIEAELGVGATTRKVAGKLIGKEIKDSAKDILIENVKNNVAKKFHFGTFRKALLNFGVDYAEGLADEGFEEFWQQNVSGVTKMFESAFDDFNVDAPTKKEVIKESVEAFKGGVEGAIFLGIFPTAGKAALRIKDWKNAREFIKETPSETMVQEYLDKTENGQKIKDQYTPEQQTTLAHDLYSHFNTVRDEEENLRAKQRSEVTSAAEGFEEVTVDEETGEKNVKPVFRNEKGELETVQTIESTDGDITKAQYKMYDPNEQYKNLYGYLNLTIDDINNTITIDKFDVSDIREGLRQEFYDKFAKENPGYEIKWDAIGEDAQTIKNSLIENNPSGKNNGLNYYTLDNVNQDFNTRKEAAKTLKTVYGDSLSNEQISQHVALIETVYKDLKRHGDVNYNTLTEFIQNEFEEGKVAQAAYSQNSRGGFKAKDVKEGLKGIIYVAQKGNFSTYSHELFHFWRSLLQGDHLAEVSKAFGVKQNADGNYVWDNVAEENAAYGFENYLATGKAETVELKKWYERLAQFMADTLKTLHDFVTMTPEMEQAYQNMLSSGSGNILADAYRAVEEIDQENNAEYYNEKYLAEQKEKIKAEEENKALEKEEKRDNIEIKAEEEAANAQDFPLSPAEENQIRTTELAKQIAQDYLVKSLTEQGFAEEDAVDVASRLKDEAVTHEEKVETIMDVSGVDEEIENDEKSWVDLSEFEEDDYNDDEIPWDALYASQSPKEKEETQKFIDKCAEDAIDYLKKHPTPENLDLLEFMPTRKGTAWYANCAMALTVQRDMDLLEAGLPIPEDSLFLAPGAKEKLQKTCRRYMEQCKKGTEGIINYFGYMSKFIGTPSKPLFSFDGSFTNCRSSKWCANNCYAANGKYGMADKIIQKEMMNRAVDRCKTSDDYNKIATFIAIQYKSMGPWLSDHMPLRIDSVGDLSQKYVDLIKVLNDKHELSVTVFSKRPELLSQIDPKKNVIMLSVDPSNYELADQYPDLPLAVVYTGKDFEVEWIEKHKEQFMKHHGVVLPAVIRGKKLSDEEIAKLPKWAYDDYVCQVDAGVQRIGKDVIINALDAEGKEHNLTNCHQCYRHNLNGEENSGCYFGRAIDDISMFDGSLKDYPREVVNEILQKAQNFITEALRAEGADESEIRSIIGGLDEFINKDLAEYDRRRTEGISQSNSQNIAGKTQETSRVENNGLTDLDNENVLQQLIEDPKEIERLNKEKTVKVYAAKQLVDGMLYPPMSKKIRGETVQGAKLGDWFKSDENPDLAFYYTEEGGSKRFYTYDPKNGTPKLGKDGEIAWYFDLDKDGKDASGKKLTNIPARYNPYWHSSMSVLNDQFSSAYKRPNIVIVELEIPESDINSGYKAEKAEKAVGITGWHKGTVSAKLSGTPDERKVILSRYIKFGRILSDAEVADIAAPTLNKYDITVPDNTMTPGLLKELISRNVKIKKTKEVENWNKLLEKLGKKNDELIDLDEQENILNQSIEYEKQNKKGIYLAANIARHDGYNMDYNDYDPKYKTDITGDMLSVDLDKYDYIIATPPCNWWSKANYRRDTSEYALNTKHLLPDILEKLGKQDKPFIVENVRNDVLFSENDVVDIVSKYGIFTQVVGRHRYYTNVFVDLWTPQEKEFSGRGKTFREYQPYRQGGVNVHRVFEKWLNTVMENFAAEDGLVNIDDLNLLRQEVYHGSAADFDKFDAYSYGFSGEGSMAFGWGTYLTGSKEIAKDYAERQGFKYFDKISKDDLGWSVAKVMDYMKQGNSFEQAKEKQIEYCESQIKKYELTYGKGHSDIAKSYYNNIEFLNKLTEEELHNRKLYTVEIPDNNFLKWDELASWDIVESVRDNLFDKIIADDVSGSYEGIAKDYLKKELEFAFNGEKTGERLYGTVQDYLGTPRAASKFLNGLGIVGMEYPAGTHYGNGDNARNYVIYDDADAKITNKMLFQTMDELLSDARNYETWQEFMEAYQMDFGAMFEDPSYHNQVPSDADAQWYQTTWELANQVTPEESLNEQEQNAKLASDDTSAAAMDAMFTSLIASDNDMLEQFLLRAAEINSIDLNSEEYQNIQSEEDAQEIERISNLQDFMLTKLAHGNWLSNAKRLRKGEELTETTRKRLLTLIRQMPREYRSIYSEIMDAPEYAVEQKDTVSEQIKKQASERKYKAVSPDEDFERMSPERLRQIADQMQNEDLARRIKNREIRMDDEIYNYIKLKEKQTREAENNLKLAEQEMQEDYQSIADWEKRRLLELNESLQKAKLKLTRRNKEIENLIEKGQKVSGKYMKDVQNMKADYNEIFRKFNDLKAAITYDVKVEEALKRQNMVYKIKEDLEEKRTEKSHAEEIKKMRIQLVKRTMRRVPFNRVDYDNAKKLIAIQRMFEPNLLGGVNRFIGVDSPYLRGIISDILTDSDYKTKVLIYLRKTAKASQKNHDFIEKIRNMKSISEFESWNKSDREYAISKLPKENWVKELNLLKLAEEREESIDLDINLKKLSKPVIDPKTGDIKTNKEGEIITESSWQVEASDEIVAMVKDAVGADMYNRLINVPFVDWTEKDLEELAIIVNDLYTEGRDILEAKKAQKIQDAAAIRMRIEAAVKNTGIIINDDDTPEEKKRKQEKIDKILGLDTTLKGTQNLKKETKINRLLHGYMDANVRRVARILDGYTEGTNTNELYWKENDAYNSKTKSMNKRAIGINEVMKKNNITMDELSQKITIEGDEYTVDEILYILAADKDFIGKEGKEYSSLIEDNDDYAATSRNAIMFGNILSSSKMLEWKESLATEDKELIDRIASGTLTPEEKELEVTNSLDTHPGTRQYILACHNVYTAILGKANKFLQDNPKYEELMKAIENDYASQYERMNEISIAEFNAPVHRTKAYVPLIRMESNGDTNENKVKEDLLTTMGSQSKLWVNKGMTQRRVSMSPLNQKPVQMGLYKTWADSVERTEHFIAYAPYVRELNRVYKSRDAQYTRQFIENRYGKGMMNYIDEYINEVANPNANKVRNAADELMHTLRGKTAPAYLAWKASSVMKQAATSPWPYMQYINPITYLDACFKCLKPGTYEAIREKSVFMNNRRFDPMADMMDEMDEKAKNWFDKAMAKQSKIGMAGLEWIDWVAVAPGWLAAYEKKYAELENKNQAVYEATKKRLEQENAFIKEDNTAYKTKDQIEAEANKAMMEDVEKRAIDYADDIVRLCQPSNRSVDISPLFKNQSEAWKAYLQFQTSLNVIWQNIRYDMPYAARNKQAKQIIGSILGYAFAGIAMNTLMEGLGGDDDDDKTESIVRRQIYNATTQFTDSVPLIGSVLSSTSQKLITGKGGYTSSGEDMTPMVTKFMNMATRTAKAITEQDEDKQKQLWLKSIASFGEGVGMYLGLPVQGTKELLKVAGVGDGNGTVDVRLSAIADNDIFNAVDNINPINQE